MLAEQQALRYAQDLSASSLRALTGEAGVQFRGPRLYNGAQPLGFFAPHLLHATQMSTGQALSGEQWLQQLRGLVDAHALRLQFSDAKLHAQGMPAQPIERWLFEALEQYRVESLIPEQWRGVVLNVRERFEQWSLEFFHSGLCDTAMGVLLYSVVQVCRARITAQPVFEGTEDFIEGTRAGIVPRLGAQLSSLRASRFSQRDFAQHALLLSQEVAMLVDEFEQEQEALGLPKKTQAQESAFKLLLEADPSKEAGFASALGGRSRVWDQTDQSYRVFTRAYDREVSASDLARPEELKGFRQELDEAMAQQGLNHVRLAKLLRAQLASPEYDDWNDGQEEGRIDGRRLHQLISTPDERHVFRSERLTPVADTFVTVLIDCSGSMKKHSMHLAMLSDVFSRALDLAQVPHEVLGFTTGAWHGGRAKRDWLKAGSSAAPGRLNELCHVVFKDAHSSWRRSRQNFAALLKLSLYREGVDAEALQWAVARQQRLPSRRGLVVVISDGCPMDGATSLANDEFYLDQHLRQVVEGLSSTNIRVNGLGVALDLSTYYATSRVVDLSQGPLSRAVLDMSSLFSFTVRRASSYRR